jgi:hypothetical protein
VNAAAHDADAVVAILCAEDIARETARYAPERVARIVSEPYDRDGTPGLACLDCNSAWPANEPASHASDCAVSP